MKLSSVFFYLSLIIVFGSCKNDFDVIDDYRNIPVVYGLLNRTDSAHYIRVERAFLSKTTSALALAQNPDSLYYPNAVVELVRLSDNYKHSFTKVDGNLEGYVRDTGIFAQAPNYLYKYKVNGDSLIADQDYRFVVRSETGDTFTTATVRIVGNYARLENEPSNQMDIKYDRRTTISMNSAEKTAYSYDLYMRFNYSEAAANSSEFTDKSVMIPIVTNLVREGADVGNPAPRFSYRMLGSDFYQKIAGFIPVTEGARRKFRSIDWVLFAASRELYNYVTVGQANLGITGAEAPPVYTNLTNGAYGIVASRNVTNARNYTLSNATRDSLNQGIYTKQLNFE